MFGKFSHLVVSSMLCVPLDLFRSPAMLSSKFIRKRVKVQIAVPKTFVCKGKRWWHAPSNATREARLEHN